tara:strand:+ start:146 stop:331 length:186 start_codon:yes stop_codon:yes gene_type:complete
MVVKKEITGFWRCDICHKQFEHSVTTSVYIIKGYPEKICEECFNRGIMFSIKEGWKENHLK